MAIGGGVVVDGGGIMGSGGAHRIRNHAGALMSLPDALLDDEEELCAECSASIRVTPHPYNLCVSCRADIADLYADEAISEGRR